MRGGAQKTDHHYRKNIFMSINKQVVFSIIIPTRNRPELFHLALKSVNEQTFKQIEIIIVNDGSTDEYVSRYADLEAQYPNVHFYTLIHRPNGHGQSYSMNYGASQAQGKYLCFLDDDDYWTDKEYLQKAYIEITNAPHKIDLHYSNQIAYFSNGDQQIEDVWIEDLIDKVKSQTNKPQQAYSVDASLLLTSNGFAHLNCSIFNREFYISIKGMDEGIRYECDRDLYIRSIDAAKHILYNPDFMSRHHIPDPKQSDNMSTMISIFEKKLYQLTVYDKAILLSKRKDVIQFCQKAKSYELKHITEALGKAERPQEAAYYARQALGASPTLKWFVYTVFISLKALPLVFWGKQQEQETPWLDYNDEQKPETFLRSAHETTS